MAAKVVSLFSGGGGLDLGFKAAGFKIIWAIDNNQTITTLRFLANRRNLQ